ncbi:MAG TPA: glycosyl hydrolase family 2 [Acidobacteriaceae bacterium]|jgi:exo-1,4-beta-D-glucosaminidase|nr:glycosyl hydrolase family 2 [Acidobacteriaceae bacterium]
MKLFRHCCPAVVLAFLGVLISANWTPRAAAQTADKFASTPLHEGWEIQSACKVSDDGAHISSTHYHPQGWIKATVPTTVLAAQLAAGIYKDPFVGMNLRNIPGGDYPIGATFSNLPMPQDSPYRCAFWYRKQFKVPADAKGGTVWLHFGGINYRANLWVNGQLIADSKQIAGAYRIYDFDVTKAVKPGKDAVIAVQIFAPEPTDLGINWVDWNPTAPDKNMGLWGVVDLRVTGPVSVRSPFITTHFEDDTLKVADISVDAELQNATDHAVDGTVKGTFEGANFEQPVTIAAGASKSVHFSPDQYPQLKLKNPAIWWPAEMGKHPLETLSVSFVSDGHVSDTTTARVGIREATSELTDKGARLFLINRKPILIRGGGWSQDLFLREDHERLPLQIQMVKDMHLNTIRLEGKLEGENFFRLTDENGILVMAGWCCCDQWEHWKHWTPENHQVSAESLRSQMLRIRHHPSVFVWLNGSDNPPPADVEQAYLNVEKETLWPNAILSSASGRRTTVTGASGVKMLGPYDYVSPSYWLRDNRYGGAYGYNTETSPGPAIPQPDSLRRFLPEKDRWPINDVWNYHAGGGDFRNLNAFNAGMRATYGWPDSMDAYSRIAQTMAYDGERAMFEAYTRNKYTSTGVIQWMLNNAWPSVIWHLYDYYLQTGGGYFGTKIACEPLHVQYSYDDHSIYVVSSLPTPVSSLTVHVEVYDFQLQRVFDQTQTVNVAADGSQHAMDIPASIFQPESSLHFVRLELKKPSGEVVSRNFYWIPSKLTEFDWKKTDYTHTEAKEFANMQILQTLPKVEIHGALTMKGRELHVHLENPSHGLAFQVQVAANSPDGKPVIPLLWSDDFVELMPGESRDLTANLPADYKGAAPTVTVTSWNTSPLSLKPAKAGAENIATK